MKDMANPECGNYSAVFDSARQRFQIPDVIDTGRYQNILQVFLESTEQYGDRPAFSCMNQSLRFRQVDKLSSDFASFLTEHCQLKVGDRIAIQLPNLLQYPVVVFGAIKAGVVIVNTNPLYTPREMEHQLNDSGAVAIVVLANMASKVEEIAPSTSLQHIIVTEIADLHEFPKRLLLNFAVKYLKKMVPKYHLPTSISFRRALQIGNRLKEPTSEKPYHQAGPEDVAVLQYTGGTTGIAKGAMLTHSNLLANMLQVSPHIELIGIEKGRDTFIAPLPLYHIYAFMLHFMTAFSLGCHSVLIPNPRDIPGFVKELNRWPLHVMVGLNTLFIALMNHPAFKKLDFSRLKTTLSGGMALSESVAREWQQMTGCAVQEGYGLTETSPVVTLNPAGHTQVGTIGIPLSATYVKVIDDEGNECPDGAAGELCVLGPQVMKGYWQRPEATAEVIKGRWLLTGDIAIIQPDGFIKIVDRKKDMILVSGFNVYPNELENVVNGHPDVLESAAVGVPDERSGEVVKLFVVRKTEALTEACLKAWCAENLTGYKCPKYIEFRDTLPKSNVGKILRRELRNN